jgi:hypothetical protein
MDPRYAAYRRAVIEGQNPCKKMASNLSYSLQQKIDVRRESHMPKIRVKTFSINTSKKGGNADAKSKQKDLCGLPCCGA